MAARKPSISRASKKAPARRKVGITVVPDAFMARVDQLEAHVGALEGTVVRNTESTSTVVSGLIARLQRLEAAQGEKPPALVLDGLVTDQLKSVIGSLRGVEESMAKVAERMAELLARAPEEKAPRKPREPKAAPAEPTNGAVAAEPGTIPAEGGQKRKVDKPDRATCTHPSKESISEKLERCVACGATLDKPAPVTPAEAKTEKPAEVKVPTFEELREKAVAFAQKHSKVKMLEVLSTFAGVPAADVKLSLVPEQQRAAAIKALEVA